MTRGSETSFEKVFVAELISFARCDISVFLTVTDDILVVPALTASVGCSSRELSFRQAFLAAVCAELNIATVEPVIAQIPNELLQKIAADRDEHGSAELWGFRMPSPRDHWEYLPQNLVSRVVNIGEVFSWSLLDIWIGSVEDTRGVYTSRSGEEPLQAFKASHRVRPDWEQWPDVVDLARRQSGNRLVQSARRYGKGDTRFLSLLWEFANEQDRLERLLKSLPMKPYQTIELQEISSRLRYRADNMKRHHAGIEQALRSSGSIRWRGAGRGSR